MNLDFLCVLIFVDKTEGHDNPGVLVNLQRVFAHARIAQTTQRNKSQLIHNVIVDKLSKWCPPNSPSGDILVPILQQQLGTSNSHMEAEGNLHLS